VISYEPTGDRIGSDMRFAAARSWNGHGRGDGGFINTASEHSDATESLATKDAPTVRSSDGNARSREVFIRNCSRLNTRRPWRDAANDALRLRRGGILDSDAGLLALSVERRPASMTRRIGLIATALRVHETMARRVMSTYPSRN